MAHEAPNRIKVERRSMPESTTDATKEIDSDASTAASFPMNRMAFCIR